MSNFKPSRAILSNFAARIWRTSLLSCGSPIYAIHFFGDFSIFYPPVRKGRRKGSNTEEGSRLCEWFSRPRFRNQKDSLLIWCSSVYWWSAGDLNPSKWSLNYLSGPLATTMNYLAPDPIVFRLCSGSHILIDNARGIIPNWDLTPILCNISIWRARVRMPSISNHRGIMADWCLTPVFRHKSVSLASIRVWSVRPDGLRRLIVYSVGIMMRMMCSRMILPIVLCHSSIREWCGLISSSLALIVVCSMLRLSDAGLSDVKYFTRIPWRLRLMSVGACRRDAASGGSNQISSRHFAYGYLLDDKLPWKLDVWDLEWCSRLIGNGLL